MFNKKSKHHSFDHFISQATKYGYFDKIKTISSRDIGPQNRTDATYRFNVTSHYGKNLKKPFRLFDQPQYKTQLKFNSNFNAFVNSIPQFQNIQEKPPKKPISMENKILNQTFSMTLVQDSAYNCDISPNKIRQRKYKYIPPQEKSLFTTKVNFNSHLNSKEIKSQTSTIIPNSPTRSPKKLNKKPNKQWNLTRSQTQKIIDEVVALKNLNKLLGTEHKRANFRISKQKLHDLVVSRYGIDVISSFFDMQTIEDFDGIIKILSLFLNSSDKLAQLLTFLTFDTNQDGIISEDDLMQLTNLLPVDSPILKDIHTLTLFTKENSTQKCTPDLPLFFLKNPTSKQFLKIDQSQSYRPKDNRLGVFRLFSLKPDDEDDDQNKNIAPRETSKTQRKLIKINFQTFQKAFQNIKRPNFFQDLCQYLIGSDEGIELSPDSKKQLQSPKKIRKASIVKQVGDAKINPNEILKDIRIQKKKISTISYQ